MSDAVQLESVQLPNLPHNLSIDDVLAAHAASKAPPPVPDAPAAVAPPAPPPEPEPPVAVAPPAPVEPPRAPSQDPEMVRLLASLQAKEQAYEARLREVEEERQRYEPLKRYAEIERMLHEQDALGAMKALGVDLKTVNEAVAAGRGVNPARAVEQRVTSKLEELQRNYETRIQALQEAQQRAQEKEAFAEISREIATRSPVLDSLTNGRATQLVYQAMTGHYQRTGEVLTYEQVIPQVEAQYTALLETALKSEAVRKRLKLDQSDAQKVTTTDPSPKTLSNALAATPAKPPTPTELPEDQEGRIEAIIAAHKAASV